MMTEEQRNLISAAADCIDEAVTYDQINFDSPPEPASEWDYNAGQLAYALRSMLTASAAPAEGREPTIGTLDPKRYAYAAAVMGTCPDGPTDEALKRAIVAYLGGKPWPDSVALSASEGRQAVDEPTMPQLLENTDDVRRLLQSMHVSSSVFVDSDGTITGYKVKTGALHRLFGMFGVVTYTGLPEIREQQTERAAFEADAKSLGIPLENISGHYSNIRTRNRWLGWQARAALATVHSQAETTAESILRTLVELKDRKDQLGKDTFYERNQPLAWERARALLSLAPRPDRAPITEKWCLNMAKKEEASGDPAISAGIPLAATTAVTHDEGTALRDAFDDIHDWIKDDFVAEKHVGSVEAYRKSLLSLFAKHAFLIAGSSTGCPGCRSFDCGAAEVNFVNGCEGCAARMRKANGVDIETFATAPTTVTLPALNTNQCIIPEAIATAPTMSEGAAASFQARVQPWMMECFGAEISADRMERNHRFFEEAGELVQACGMTREEAHALVDYTWGRPVGDPKQEVGGVMVTLAALCLANTLDMHLNAEQELYRISQPYTIDKIRAKQAAKPKHSPLPAHPASEPITDAARAFSNEEARRLYDEACLTVMQKKLPSLTFDGWCAAFIPALLAAIDRAGAKGGSDDA